MLRATSFVENELKKAEEIYKMVQYSPRQRALLISIAGILHKYIPISELALRGFILRAAKEYQLTHQKTILDVENESLETRFQAMKEGFRIVETYLIKILKDPNEKNLVKKAIHDALNYYREFVTQDL